MQEDSFTTRYRKLNAAQKKAVDTIEGPVMVIAGPGTGKTELLSMRVANILKKTDTLPQNILCLTFTESGASAMRKRLVGLMGAAAYRVAIHTFHSFGSEVINCYPDYFYHGAHFRAADELNSYEILQGIFEKLPHDNPLASQMNGEFTYLRDAQNSISELKRSGLTPDELLKILDHNDAFIEYITPVISKVFSQTIRSKKSLPLLEPLQKELSDYADRPMHIPGYGQLSKICRDEFQSAYESALETGKTTPITTWRNRWCEKSAQGEFVMKDQARAKKLRAIAHLYYEYLVAMQAQTLYDFDDMILRVVHALEVFDELRLNLQEKYQYILVDEFQDTNGAQLRILLNLTNNEVYNGRPNILVVGDDDQAIYSFQGAEISNILTFRDQFRDPQIITLTDNYRSAAPILTEARNIITQGQDRLESHIASLDKTLSPHATEKGSTVELFELPTKSEEYFWLANEVKRRIAAGQRPHEIAILTRKHSEMTHLLPYFHHAGIAVNYERRDNVLELPPIVTLEKLARVLLCVTQQQFDKLSALLPELLSHPAWNIPPMSLWKLGLDAYKSQKHWLEAMLETKGPLKDIAEWLIVTAHRSVHLPLEEALDVLMGQREPQVPDDDTNDTTTNTGPTEGYISPLRDYFFPHDALETQPNEYVTYLHALQTIRRKLRDYQPDADTTLESFISFIDLHRKTKTTISNPRSAAEEGEGVCLMTAHKSKGLEFETVFMVNATHTTWGSGARTRGRAISYPANLPLSPAGETDDERLRLFFVGMTRAKRELLISYALSDLTGKPTLRANFLVNESWNPKTPQIQETPALKKEVAENQWYENVLSITDGHLPTLLKPTLESYKLSPTHLNNFIDVTSGGPQAFFLQNILRFPQAIHPSAAYGSAIHKTLQRAHAHLSATSSRRPVEDILHDFETSLGEHHLGPAEYDYFVQKGSDVLQKFLAKRYDTFSEQDIVERSFAYQGVVIEGAALNGALDLMLIDEANRSITVVDYKTGKPPKSWKGTTDFEKVKLHKYRQQLMFYKLLVENSRDFGGKYTVDSGILEFVEPAGSGEVIQLDLAYDPDELEHFTRLIKAVWNKIQALDFPDTRDFDASYKGILDFEQYLIDK